MNHATLATSESLTKTLSALEGRHFKAESIATGAQALTRIQELIPAGASVMNGASMTLQQIGYIEYLKSGGHGWKNLHETILTETDPVKQEELRKYSVVSDFYVGSVHAVTENGELVIASNTGSQLPHLAYTSPNVILVVSTKKIVPDIASAFDRIDTHVVPLEDERMKQVYGFGTLHAKTLILHQENPALGRTVQVLLVEEDLGF